jgi:GNAT superfamily N-acetyltransferase
MSPSAPAKAPVPAKVRVVPLTAARWPDLVELFGPKGAYGGCWCMFFRLPRAEWAEGCKAGGRGNKRALAALAGAKRPPGLLAYVGREVAGWCAVAPREEYVRLATSRTLKPLDDTPVWSVTCFYVARAHRRKGVTVALLEAAAKFAARHGATMLEGYPNEPKARWPDAYAYQGTVSAFARAGFREVKRVSPTRAIMRRQVRGAAAAAAPRARAARTKPAPKRRSPRG